MEIRAAVPEDYAGVREFYYALTDAMQYAQYRPGWRKDVYPSQPFLLQSIEQRELYIGTEDREIAACMVVNHAYNDGYRQVRWGVEAEDSELLVIHALGVRPNLAGRGLAKEMVRWVIERARETNVKAVRLDVLNGNIPAEKAYTGLGFQYRGTIPMFYEDTGWADFKAYERMV